MARQSIEPTMLAVDTIPALPAAEGTASSEMVQGVLPSAFRDGIHYCDASKMPELL